MRTRSIAMLVAVLTSAAPRTMFAQVKTPGENTVAIGGHVGFHAMDTETDSVAANLDAFFEYYYTPRSSIRTMYSWAQPELQSAPKRTLRQQRILVNYVYNWEIGRFRPFATLGGGAYFLQRREAGESVGERVTKPGGNIGWGVEFYLRTFALRTEMNVHVLNKETSLDWDGELSGFSWSFGVKVPF